MTRTTEAFESAVAPHYAGLVRRLTAVVRDPEAGQDLAQDAYLRAFRAWDRFDGTDARAWLHTIGLRLAFNERLALPFAPAAEEGNLGTRIAGAIEIDGRLILVGEQDRVATFWIGEQP